MNKEELMQAYEINRQKLHTTKDQSHMEGAEKYMNKLTHYLMITKPEIVEEGLEIWNAEHVNNYITQSEAMEGISHLINTTGEASPKWKSSVLFEVLKGLDVPVSQDGVFNDCALFYTMNWLYSDFARPVSKYIEVENIPLYFYECAVEKLNDPDNTRWIRKHLKLE